MQVRARFDGAMKMKPGADGEFKDGPEYIRRRWGKTLRALYIAQQDVAPSRRSSLPYADKKRRWPG